jgi:multidrug transporter EmrE-like cation transporter
MSPEVLIAVQAVHKLSKKIGYLIVFGLVFYAIALQFFGQELDRDSIEAAVKYAIVAFGIQILIEIFFGDKIKMKS